MVTRALRLDNVEVKMTMRHPLLEGKKPFARGVFSAVFPGTRANRVLKMTVDNIGYWLFNDNCVGVQHRHFPRVIESHGDIGSVRIGEHHYPIYLYEMERLQKLRNSSPAWHLASLIINRSDSVGNYADFGDQKAAMELRELIADSTIPRSVRNALKLMEEFCSYFGGGGLDFHSGNFMQRKNGDLVMIDPLANYSIWRAAVKQLCGRGW